MTVWIMKMEVTFSPGCILRGVWAEPVSFEKIPERIHVRNMKNDSAPTHRGLALLQVDDWKCGLRNPERRKS